MPSTFLEGEDEDGDEEDLLDYYAWMGVLVWDLGMISKLMITRLFKSLSSGSRMNTRLRYTPWKLIVGESWIVIYPARIVSVNGSIALFSYDPQTYALKCG